MKPASTDQVVSAVQSANESRTPLAIIGHGSKVAIGNASTANTLDLSKLFGINFYEPEELVLSAKAGTPLIDIEKLLAKSGQQLAFEPMDYGFLLGGKSNKGTIGGVLAINAAGPRRLKAGAARDHILGIEAVSGRGELFKSGGRVMKNVTGYDLSKGLAGSWGTLAVITDVTFKVLPAAETEVTLVLRGLDDAQSAIAMSLSLGSSAEVSSAAHLPYTVASSVIGGALKGEPATLLRIEGFPKSVSYRVEQLAKLLKIPSDILPVKISRTLWREIRDVMPFADGSNKPVWRVSLPPMSGHEFVAALRLKCGVDAYYDWQGGLVWLRMEGEPEAAAVRALINEHGGGHATLIRASPEQRVTNATFHPQVPQLAALTQRIKDQFDPHGILNAGRFK